MFAKRLGDDSLVIGAPAKINLFLQVLEKRADGYHNISSAFQAVSLFDRLSFRIVETPTCTLKLKNRSNLSVGPDNLVVRACRMMREEFGLNKGIEVELEKNIPIAAGLGGGSADAAATLKACNLLFGLGLSRKELADLGLRLGSDVPFFFGAGQALVAGRGECVDDIELPTDYWLVLVNPAVAVSTAESYASLKRSLTESREGIKFVGCRKVDDLVVFLSLSGNDFEKFHLETFPRHKKIRDGLLRLGAKLVRMSGTGPTFFGVFEQYPGEELSGHFVGENWQVYTVRPITLPSQAIA